MLLLSESSVDFKYRKIYSHLNHLIVFEGKFPFLLKKLLSNRDSIYHIRYIKYKNFPIAFLRLLIVFFSCKLTNSKIVWTCHNIYEHNIKSKKANNFLRFFLLNISSNIIIFHEGLKGYIPSKFHLKVTIANFGNFTEFVENQERENLEFKNLYREWLIRRKAISPSIVSISAAKRNKLNLLLEGVKETNINTLVVAPKYKINEKLYSDNILFYNTKFVRAEVRNILSSKGNLVGYIGHDNISVPTSIYMYASYRIPVIGYNIEPVSSIINNYNIGITINKSEEFFNAYNQILDNYIEYSNNTKVFIMENNWEKAAKVHRITFES